MSPMSFHGRPVMATVVRTLDIIAPKVLASSITLFSDPDIV
jgi:hypothetical protein